MQGLFGNRIKKKKKKSDLTHKFCEESSDKIFLNGSVLKLKYQQKSMPTLPNLQKDFLISY